MIKPLGEFIVLEPVKEEKKKSAILLPDDDKNESDRGKVIAVGDQVKDIKKGDVVFFAKYSDQKIKHEGKDYSVVKHEKILAKAQ